MKNCYLINKETQIVLIDAYSPDGVRNVITISLNKLEAALKCTGSWTLYRNKTGKLYARGYIRNQEGKIVRVDMHRYLTNCPRGKLVDHRDGNGLNNCDDNFRIGTHTMNNQNASSRKDNSTGFTGVSKMKNGMYRATISIKGKNKHIGTYPTAFKASDAYQLAKQKSHPYADKNTMIFI